MNKEEEYINYVKNSIKVVKQIDDEITKKESDLIKFGKARSRCNLETDKLDAQMKIYVTYLGYLDALIFCIKDDIDRGGRIDLYKEKLKLEKYLNQRNKVLKIIKLKMVYRTTVHNIDEILEEVPSFTKFNLIYDYLKDNSFSVNTHDIEFITSYNIGFAKRYGFSYEFMTNMFETSCAEIDIHNSKNVKKLAKVKVLKNKKNRIFK